MEVKVLEKLVDYYRENKLSHAYLIETNNTQQCLEDLKCIVAKIFCSNDYKENCNECNICSLIKQNYLPSLMVIEPSGNTIKKEQVLELKRAFSSLPIYTNENIYIIKSAEALTDASANTMLKFVEEPTEHIIGFFITNNINNVISTIRSRCEILKVFYDEKELSLSSLKSEDWIEYYELTKKYLYKLEVEKKEMIMYNKDVLLNTFTERNDIKKIFNIILIAYEELLKKVNGQAYEFDFNDFNFLDSLDFKAITKRIDLVIRFLEDLESNANVELLLDKFVIELSDVYV